MAEDENENSSPGPKKSGGPRKNQDPPSWSIPDRSLWPAFEKLSTREQRIIGLVVHGHSSKEVGALENDTENAIEQVVKRIRAKCGGAGRRELTRSYIAWEKARYQSFSKGRAPAEPLLNTDRFPVDRLAALHGSAESDPQPVSVHRDDADDDAGLTPPLQGGAPPAEMVLRLPVGIDGSGRNALRKYSSTFAVILIATLAVVFAGAILSLLRSADSLQIGH